MSFLGYKIIFFLLNNLWLCKLFAVLWLVFVFFVGIALLGGTNSAKSKLLVLFDAFFGPRFSSRWRNTSSNILLASIYIMINDCLDCYQQKKRQRCVKNEQKKTSSLIVAEKYSVN